MVTIIEPTARPTVTLNVGTNETLYAQHGAISEQDELSKNALMSEAMMQINQDSQDYQQELWEQRDADPELPPDEMPNDYPYEEQPQYQVPEGEYEEYPQEEYGQEEEQVEAKPRRTRKKAAKKVEGSLGYNLRQKNKETDYYEKQLQVKEALYQETLQRERDEKERMQKTYELALEKNRINDDIAKVSGVLMSAKQDQQYDTEVEANLLLQKLVNQQSYLEREEQQLRADEPIADEEDSEFEQLASQELYQFSDARDLKSPVYGEFLEKYPICNPYSSDYDRDLAEEIWQIRKGHNRELKINGMSSYIGSEEYYQEVEDLIDGHFNKSRRKSASRPRQQSQYQGDPDMYSQNGTGHTIAIGDGDQYGADYAPNYDPSFRKNSDMRDPESGNASGYRQPQNYQPRQEPQQYQQQQGYAQQGYGQSRNDHYQQRQAPVAPVSRDGYSQNRYTQQLPDLDHIELNMARSMQGMRFPNGKAMNENERIMEYRKMKGDRLNGQNRR